ncbi:MAG: glycosyltransferase family 39 protein [Candidatus Levybacteria bacterium]|nr:glycosyltransferase family 39 protein [Candidatus Levybacteria bacterium]
METAARKIAISIMFTIAVSIGIYSYLIFTLGLLGLLYRESVIIFSLLYAAVVVLAYKRKIIYTLKLIRIGKTPNVNFGFVLITLIVSLALVNLIGAFGPELGFDALWYHLTLPKIYLVNHDILHIPGGLLYYSSMPKLTEMIYVGALSFGNELVVKLVHFSFGIISLIALYNLSRNFLNKTYSLITVLIFYSNLVVAWQSTTAYIDLARTFFEIMALFGFINWWKSKNKKWLMESAVMMGLAISTKLLAIGSLIIFSALIALFFFYHKRSAISFAKSLSVYWFISLLIPLPWFVFSFIHTGNPVYPFFTNLYKIGLNLQFINPFIHRSDSISIVYIIIPFVFPFVFTKFKSGMRIVSLYSILAFAIWYLTPKTDWGRFIMPYLPAFSIVCSAIILTIKKYNFLKNLAIGLVILSALITMFYRLVASAKYISVILGIETKNKFLTDHLNFSFGDFYDTDGYFSKNITRNNKVLLYGFHNLYYVDFPFIDSSWVKKGDVFDYIAVQNSVIPKRFSYWNLVYYNKKTNVKLYSLGGQKWVY